MATVSCGTYMTMSPQGTRHTPHGEDYVAMASPRPPPPWTDLSTCMSAVKINRCVCVCVCVCVLQSVPQQRLMPCLPCLQIQPGRPPIVSPDILHWPTRLVVPAVQTKGAGRPQPIGVAESFSSHIPGRGGGAYLSSRLQTGPGRFEPVCSGEIHDVIVYAILSEA